MPTVVRIPAQLRVIDCAPPLGHFVRLDRWATGRHGWLGNARALLIEAQEKGRVLVGVFAGQRPSQYQGICVHASLQLPPEAAIAALCLRDGIALSGCGLYIRQFPSFASAAFFSHTGISRLLYAVGERRSDALSQFSARGVEVIRVAA